MKNEMIQKWENKTIQMEKIKAKIKWRKKMIQRENKMIQSGET